MGDSARAVLATLMAGNERFRTGKSRHHRYTEPEIAAHASLQRPIACVVSCSDSRVCPEVIFDQPLGALFVARVPGNVCCDSAKWTIDIAVTEFKVPLVMVVGHTRCLAVTQVFHGTDGGEGGPLRSSVLAAVMRSHSSNAEDRLTEAICRNASMAVEQLARDSRALRQALAADTVECVASLYDVVTGIAMPMERTASWV